jgi:hypothetical protein
MDDRIPLALARIPGVLRSFGGEDPVNGGVAGDPTSGWYHELITRDGAAATGPNARWAVPDPARGIAPGSTAADSIAWHADYLDSYLYNPLWWFNLGNGGGLGRLGVALMARPELTKMHFDDLTSTSQIRTMWRRYLGGTVAALVWAAEHNDVDAARNAIGTSLHAMQDFYSHSSWMDSAERRTKTWFEAGTPVLELARREPRPTRRPLGSPLPLHDLAEPLPLREAAVRDRLTGILGRRLSIVGADPRPGWDLFTGMYEVGLQHGYKSHGKYAYDCTVYRALPIGLRDAATAVLSFVGMEDVAHRWRSCTGDASAPATPPALAGVPAPPGILVLAPTGIALDNKWMAEISRSNRSMDDTTLTGEQLFAIARGLATRTTSQWLEELDRIGRSHLELINVGFWDRVKNQGRQSPGATSAAAPNPPTPGDIRQYEDPAQQPFTIISAGQYPPDPTETGDGWWLRVTLGTSTQALSGTNADIVLKCSGQEFLLDHGRLRSPTGSWSENRLLEWDDFEAGSRAAYVVGPFAALPSQIILANRAASAGAIVAAAWNDFTEALSGVIEAIGDVLLSLVGGHADLVGNGQQPWTWAQLMQIAGQGFPGQGLIDVDGGTEGHYQLSYDLWVSRSGDDLFCQVTFRTLSCLRESDWDRFTAEDEPFVLALVSAPATGQSTARMLGPYTGIDTGDFATTSDAPPVFAVVRRGSGLIVAIQVMESDDETPAQRGALLSSFATKFAERSPAPRGEFLDALGTAQAPDWRIGDIEVFAFRRNGVVEAGMVLPRTTVGAWLDAGTERAFPFSQPPRTAIPLRVS